MKRFDSVQGRINLIFLAFALLVMLSVGATFWGIQTQRMDALLINLAGRQRMLTQKIIWLALAQPDNPELQSSIQLFELTQTALRQGGTASSEGSANVETRRVTLPPAPDPTLRLELDEAARLWADFRHHLEPVDSQALQAASPALLSQLDDIVNLFEDRAEAKLKREQVIQIVTFLAALVLLVWGYLLTRKRVFSPLEKLGAVARRMAGGQLVEPVPPLGNDELGELGSTFETLRLEVSNEQDKLEGRVAQRTRELMAAFELSQEIVSQLDLDHLLRSVAEHARSLTAARAAALCLLEEGQPALVLSASSPESHLNTRQPLHRDPAACVVFSGETVTTRAECVSCAFLQSHAPGETAIAPLRLGETSLGALCVLRDPGQTFDPDETRALALLSNAAALAIANARLIESERRRAEQAAVSSERERLAADLHDHLAQTLSFLNLQIDRIKELLPVDDARGSVERLDQMKSTVGEAYEQVRSALVSLSEPQPAARDFSHRLAGSLDEIRQATGMSIELEIVDPAALELPRLAQAQALLIVREALTNVRKHAGAQHVCVRVERLDGQSRFIVEDNGCGFDPQGIQGSHHLGLRLMRARAERSGGILLVESAPGRGTRVVVGFPLGSNE